MKKLLIMLIISTLFLVGCQDTPSESGVMDYAAMDQKYGQSSKKNSNEKFNDSSEFTEDIPDITTCLENYTFCFLKEDATKYMQYVPKIYITALAKTQKCTEAEARHLAQDTLAEKFKTESGNYSTLKTLIGEFGCSIARIDSIHRVSQTEIEEYKKLGIEVTEIINVEYTVTASDESAVLSTTLVHLEDETWAIALVG